MAACWALRIFEAATICMALVICAVLLIDRMRRRISRVLAMIYVQSGLNCSAADFSSAVNASFSAFCRPMSCSRLALDVVRNSVSLAWYSLIALDRHAVDVAVLHHPEHGDLHFDGNRIVLRLVEELDDPLAAVDFRLRRGIQVGAELRERGQLAKLRQVALQPTGHLFHRLELRGGADARDRDADRDRRPDALIEQVGLQEDLPVGDRDDVRRDVRRDVAGLRLDDRQRGQRAVAVLSRRRGRRVPAAGCEGRTRRPDTLRGPTAVSAPATPAGRPRHVWTDRRRRSARPCRDP